MINIDGSKNEGGGQIMRTAISLSVITQKPCHIANIRKKRPRPGLSHQHLLGLRALTEFCKGKIEGDLLGSQEIKFYPGQNYKKQIFLNIPTAGSITLVLQTLILPALFSDKPTKISFNGGATDTFFSPTIDHFQFVFLKILGKMLAPNQIYSGTEDPKINIETKKRGFYPEGGASVETAISPASLMPISLIKRGSLKKVFIISGASKNLEKKRVAQRQISGAKQILGKLKLPLEEKTEYYSSESIGSQINIIAELENTIFGTDNLGKLGKSAEIVGQEAAQEFLQEVRSNACLDKHLADQILPYMALASGQSQITVSEITNHAKTNIWVTEQFLDNGKFEIRNNTISWIPK